MAEEEEDVELELTHTGVHVHSRDHVVVSAVADEFAEDDRDHAFVYHWRDEDWTQQLIDDNSICGVSSVEEPGPKILGVGVDGRVDFADFDAKRYGVEQVDSSSRAPNYSETLRCVRRIGGEVYAAGMARQVYRRRSADDWVQWDQGVYLPRGQRDKAVGFLDIDGPGNGQLYAVGYKGEIWYFDGDAWEQEDSPTNVALTCIAWLGEQACIGGLAGAIIRGSHGQWSVLSQDETAEDFWGIAQFAEQVFLSNYDGIFRIDGDALVKHDLGLGESFTTAYLHAADGVMWSVGQKHIAVTEDGVNWVEIDVP